MMYNMTNLIADDVLVWWVYNQDSEKARGKKALEKSIEFLNFLGGQWMFCLAILWFVYCLPLVSVVLASVPSIW